MAPGNLQAGYYRSRFSSKPYPLRNSTARNCAINMEVSTKETDDLSKVDVVGKINGGSENDPNLDSNCHKTAAKGKSDGDGNTTAKDAWHTESRLRTQIRKLRSLSLLHLDVIDQQQRQLTAREKELSKVRSEKYTLEQRLERMQRRTSLAEKASRSPSQVVKTAELTAPVKRKIDTQPSPAFKRSTTREGAPSKQPKLQQPESFRDKRRQKQQQRKEEAPSRAKGAKTEAGDSKEILNANSSEPVEDPKKVLRLEDRFFFTDVLYPTLLDLRVHLPDTKLTSNSSEVEIPSWRTSQQQTDLPITDEVENIDDETYDRRHSKMELEEKKRKRWDAQRIRELRTIERMEWKAVQKEMAKYAHIVTKYTSEPVDAKKIEVSESIPVVAFGALVPKLKNKGFSLPWFNLADKERDETRRHTRSQASKK